MTSHRIIVRALVGAGLLAPIAAHAADHNNTESGLPVVIEDAYTIKRNGLEAQGYLRYDRTRDDSKGPDRFTLVPRLEWGPARNLQLTVEAPYRVGNATQTHEGEVTAQALYSFNNEGALAPALAVQAGVTKQYGQDAGNGGTESSFGLLATKSIGSIDRSYVPRRVSINAIWYHNYNPKPEERTNRYRAGIAYAQPVANDFVLVADVYRETNRMRGEAENVAELGTRFQFDPQTVFSFGAGAGFADNSPRFRLLIGFQRALSFPWSRPRR